MTIELTLLISLIMSVITAFATFATMKHRNKTDTQNETAITTTMMVKLENIGNNVAEIKGELTSLKGDTKENRERIIRVEESVKQAHKRLDTVEAQEKGVGR